jgi:hypothetical protein
MRAASLLSEQKLVKHIELNRAEHIFNPWLDSVQSDDRTPHEGTPNTLIHS